MPFTSDGVLDFYQFAEFLEQNDLFDVVDKLEQIYIKQKVKKSNFACCYFSFRCLRSFNLISGEKDRVKKLLKPSSSSGTSTWKVLTKDISRCFYLLNDHVNLIIKIGIVLKAYEVS